MLKKITETERIYLRELEEVDYDDLCEILQDAETMYAYEHAFTDIEVRNWLNKQFDRYRQFGFGLWAVIEKNQDNFIGQVGLSIQEVNGIEELEIGYLIKRRFWHQGYATEAAIACRDYAFYHLHKDRVVSIIRDTNLASQNVAKRLGMKVECLFVKHYYNMDLPHYLYSMCK